MVECNPFELNPEDLPAMAQKQSGCVIELDDDEEYDFTFKSPSQPIVG